MEPDRFKLGNLLTDIYDSCTVFSSDPEVEMCTTTEKKVWNYAQTLLLNV